VTVRLVADALQAAGGARSAAETAAQLGIARATAQPATARPISTRRSGPRTATEGAAVVIRLAPPPGDGPTGGLFSQGGAEPW
jgi:hypothetical protein